MLAGTIHKLGKGPAVKYVANSDFHGYGTPNCHDKKKSGGPKGEVSNVKRVNGAPFLSPLKLNEW